MPPKLTDILPERERNMPARVYIEMGDGTFITGYILSMRQELNYQRRESLDTDRFAFIPGRREIRIDLEILVASTEPVPLPPDFRRRVRAGLSGAPEKVDQVATEEKARKEQAARTRKELREAGLKRFKMLDFDEDGEK